MSLIMLLHASNMATISPKVVVYGLVISFLKIHGHLEGNKKPLI